MRDKDTKNLEKLYEASELDDFITRGGPEELPEPDEIKYREDMELGPVDVDPDYAREELKTIKRELEGDVFVSFANQKFKDDLLRRIEKVIRSLGV